ncbi:MAG: hypothetical protein SPJ27_09280, partial [Candidatus Onthovivens sp.]|nr:hypothetical protein [Candidatus Onthovivens sp.]
IEVESWLSAKEVDNLFNVNLLDEAKECNACVDNNLFKRYKNVPDKLLTNSSEEINNEPEEEVKESEEVKEEPKQQEVVEEIQDIDYSYFENKLNSVRGEDK